MTIKFGSNKACAACKYQRRRCSEECPLAPYFPADKPNTFNNAHRLFGVCYITRILNQVKPHEKDEAMKSIIFESDVRAKYPVEGCYGVMLHYTYMISKGMEELRYMQMLLAFCKEHSKLKHHHLPMPLVPTMPLLPMDQCSISPTHSNEFPIYNHDEDISLFDSNLGNVYGANDYMEKKDIYMETSSCRSDIINNVSTSFLDEKSNSMSVFGPSYRENQLDPIAIVNNMDPRSSKFNLIEERESSYHHKRDISKYYHHTIPLDLDEFGEFGDNRLIC